MPGKNMLALDLVRDNLFITICCNLTMLKPHKQFFFGILIQRNAADA
jgi:hypothetical protein